MPDIFISKSLNKTKKLEPEETTLPKPTSGLSLERLPGHTHNPFASYCNYPEKVNFETKEEKEKIVLFLRQHPIVNLKWILIALVLILVPSFALGFNNNFLPGNFRFIAILCWYLATSGYIFQNFLSWFFNVYIVTDERVVDVDFVNLIYKEVSDANIDKIQDVTYTMGGVARTFFNYGDVTIQTASEVPNFDFLAVPNPDKVVKILQELRREEEQERLEGRLR
jgi:membrane protein YdbS with pleckstrin-like domain